MVLDACGVGALPDAADYGDAGTNTLGHLAAAVPGGLSLPALGRLGLGSILPLDGVPPTDRPVVHGRLHPLGPGKDSTTGHWELMGAVAPAPLPTYPDGFPASVIREIERVSGRPVIGNVVGDGLSAIEELGEEALRERALIVYTSQDSVLQIAAHVDAVPTEELHAICVDVRGLMQGEHAVGRVIARPFAGTPGAFERTRGRRDVSLPPPGRSHVDELRASGIPIHAVGKVAQLFPGLVDEAHPGATNAEAIESTTALLRSLDAGFVFTNLIETDQVYGHRKDVDGFHRALRGIDAAVAEWLALLREDDLLILTADHGVDVTHPGTDHTREYAPLLAVFREGSGTGAAGATGRDDAGAARAGSRTGAAGATGRDDAGAAPARTGEPWATGRRDGPLADVGASVLRWLARRDTDAVPGRPFTPEPVS